MKIQKKPLNSACLIAGHLKVRPMLARWRFIAVCSAVFLPAAAQAAVISFEASDFSIANTYSQVSTFSFEIDLAGPLAAGTAYTNPTLNSVNYSVSGLLESGTPSGFPAFNLVRSIGGAEFYQQGSSLAFSIAASADLSDGLQLDELIAAVGEPVFSFNGHEDDTGRYHPSLVELFSDGSGRIQNSNNTGGVNPSSGEVVNVDFGEEFISDLSFTPSALTLAAQPIPLPSAAFLFASGLLLMRLSEPRKT